MSTFSSSFNSATSGSHEICCRPENQSDALCMYARCLLSAGFTIKYLLRSIMIENIYDMCMKFRESKKYKFRGTLCLRYPISISLEYRQDLLPNRDNKNNEITKPLILRND